jgi:cyclophilin family peptidyl-prolyl cis-trans isomerase
MTKYIIPLLFICLFFQSCGNDPEKKKSNAKTEKSAETKPKSSFGEFNSSVFTITTYDGKRRLEEGTGFFVSDSIVVTLYSLFGNAKSAVVVPWTGEGKYEVEGFVAVDRINDLVLLKVKGLNRPGLKLYTGAVPQNAITRLVSKQRGNVVPVNKGKMLQEVTVQGVKLFRISNPVSGVSRGRPVFLKNREVLGVGVARKVDYNMEYFAIPSSVITTLINKRENKLSDIAKLGGTVDGATSAANARVKGVLIETDFGSIKMRLFNDMPAYRDNFLKLVREHYYDSLLWHRVIEGFVVQSGAADTRYASKDDIVGWKGPGYTLPANIHPKYFHKRGVVGVPRLPDSKNVHKRSDGSQFYIVSGRIYHDEELDVIEREKKIKFSAGQRTVYKSAGGAPTLDGEYTIFGEVTEGMDVVDRINALGVDRQWRPKQDLRVNRISIIY